MQHAHEAIRSKPCAHERSHVIDSMFHGGGYSTPESRQIFCDVCRLQRWLDVEAALALSQSELEMIPHEAANIIAKAAHIDRLDLHTIATGIATSGHSLVPLLRALQSVIGNFSSQFVHHGATTQDIQDTAQSLEMRDVFDQVEHQLVALLDKLEVLALDNREQLTVGRTHAQPALPTTFGRSLAPKPSVDRPVLLLSMSESSATVNGRPLCKLSIPKVCQPARSVDRNPLFAINVRLFPHGKSYP